MLRRGEEIARLRRVVGGLFGDIVAAGAIGIVPVTGECLSEDGIEWLFHASVQPSMFAPVGYQLRNVRRFDVPSTQVEFDHRYKALNGVINGRHW